MSAIEPIGVAGAIYGVSQARPEGNAAGVRTIRAAVAKDTPSVAQPANDAEAAAGSGDIDVQTVERSAAALNAGMELLNRSVRFLVRHSGSGIQAFIVDNETDRVIRSVPPNALLELSERMRSNFGLGVGMVLDASS